MVWLTVPLGGHHGMVNSALGRDQLYQRKTICGNLTWPYLWQGTTHSITNSHLTSITAKWSNVETSWKLYMTIVFSHH